jgi:mono/diheme cytochrome c family protein
MKLLKLLLGLAVLGLLGGSLFIYFGMFSVAADEPHSKPFFWLMNTELERSIAMRAKYIEVPSLDDPATITSGGADYNEMCTGCHLQPGVEKSELRVGMYPKPPNLTQVKRADPAQTFWIIKHGIKMSAMPAWGATHDDQSIWAMVAFLQQLPRLTPAQYQILTAPSEEKTGGSTAGMAMPSE